MPQEVTERLDRPPLDDEQLYDCMDGWKDGFWKLRGNGPLPSEATTHAASLWRPLMRT